MTSLTHDELTAAAFAVEHLIVKHQYDGIRGRDGKSVNLEALKSKLLAVREPSDAGGDS